VEGDTDSLAASGLDMPPEQEHCQKSESRWSLMRKSLRCMLGRHHWVMLRTEGEVFVRCSRCQKRDYEHYYDGDKAKQTFEQQL
jgi:hypothetical protein